MCMDSLLISDRHWHLVSSGHRLSPHHKLTVVAGVREKRGWQGQIADLASQIPSPQLAVRQESRASILWSSVSSVQVVRMKQDI